MTAAASWPLATPIKVLVLGASGMLGHQLFQKLFSYPKLVVSGTVRSKAILSRMPEYLRDRLIVGVDVADIGSIARVLDEHRPDVIINCVGLVKQLDAASDPVQAIQINALLPHLLARLSAAIGSRLVHFSTDCVFDGRRGGYTEADTPDAVDLYGRTKSLGEVNQSHCLTLRTSIIGKEIGGSHGLIEWFLSQTDPVKGYRRAIFSGLTTNEMVRVIAEQVIPRTALSGTYHLASDPIDKLSLLRLVNRHLRHGKTIVEDDAVVIDRSLDGSRFHAETGYKPPSWSAQIEDMMRD